MTQQLKTAIGILLAAGQSSRFGSDKLLHELTIAGKSQPLILHSLQLWFSVFEEMCIVIRPDNKKLRNVIVSWATGQHQSLKLIEYQHARLGMGHSLTAAVSATSEADGWVIGLADMPLIPQSVLHQIAHNLKQGADITAPYFDERRGHPVGISGFYKDELLALKGDTGAKTLLQREAGKIHKIETNEQGVLMDVDSVDDASLIERLSNA